MKNYVPTPKISEILIEEFMKPLGLSAYKLAKDINVPVSRIQDLLHDRRRMTADTSVRLGKYFNMSEDFFLRVQDDIDIRNAKLAAAKELDSIKICSAIASKI